MFRQDFLNCETETFNTNSGKKKSNFWIRHEQIWKQRMASTPQLYCEGITLVRGRCYYYQAPSARNFYEVTYG